MTSSPQDNGSSIAKLVFHATFRTKKLLKPINSEITFIEENPSHSMVQNTVRGLKLPKFESGKPLIVSDNLVFFRYINLNNLETSKTLAEQTNIWKLTRLV